jgi:predicted nucleic acid-binding protein
LIASTAIVHKRVLVTGNLGHYQHMLPFGLTTENWR